MTANKILILRIITERYDYEQNIIISHYFKLNNRMKK